MEEQGDYELLPHEQIEHLRRELDRLKNNPFVKGHEDEKLFAAVKNLTNSVDKLYDLFNNVQEDLIKEFGESGDGPSEKMNVILEQNKHIAQGILSLAKRLEKTETKVDRHEFVRPKRHVIRPRFSEFTQVAVPEERPVQEKPIQQMPVQERPIQPQRIPEPKQEEDNNQGLTFPQDVSWDIPAPQNTNFAEELNPGPVPVPESRPPNVISNNNPINPSNIPPRFNEVPQNQRRVVAPNYSNIQNNPQQQNLPRPNQQNMPSSVNPRQPNYPPNISRSSPLLKPAPQAPNNSFGNQNNISSSNNAFPPDFGNEYIDPNFPNADSIPSVPNQQPQLTTPISAIPKKKKFLGIF